MALKRLVLGVLLLLGCDRPPAAPAPARQVVVFATLYPLADLCRQIGGDTVRVDWLLDMGDPIDHYALSRPERERITAADLILCDGVGRTETWAQQDFGLLRDVGNVISADVLLPARDAPAEGLLYLDPEVAKRYAVTVADALTRRLPARSDVFHANAKTFGDAITAIASGFKAPTGAKVMVVSNDFDPLLARLGVATVLVDADPLAFTTADADAVKKKAKQTGVRAMLVPFDTPPGTLALLEEQTGLRVFPLDRLGYPNFEQHASYLDVLRYDLDELKLATSQ